MRITIAIAVLLLFITSAAESGADKAKEIQKASDLLARSRAVVVLDKEASFRMEATLHVVDENGHEEDGTYNILLGTPDRFREEIVLGTFRQTRVINGGQEWHRRSLTYVPLRVDQLRDLLPWSPNFADVPLGASVTFKEQREKSVKVLCINGESGGRYNTICIDEQTAAPTYVESDRTWHPQRARMDFLDYAPFANGKQIPRTIRYSIGEKTLLEIHIVKLETPDTSDLASNTAFAPLEGIQPVPACAPFQRAEGFGISPGFSYDSSQDEYFEAFGVVGGDGKLRDLQTVRSIDAKTDAAAEMLLNNGRYTAAKCNGSTIDQESLFLLSSDTVALKSAPEANSAGYSDVHCIYCPQPKYTADTIRAHVQGVVFLHCIVSAEGRVTNASILRSLSSDLDKAAIEAVHQWRFQAATGPDGKPAVTSVEIEINFRLPN